MHVIIIYNNFYRYIITEQLLYIFSVYISSLLCLLFINECVYSERHANTIGMHKQ